MSPPPADDDDKRRRLLQDDSSRCFNTLLNNTELLTKVSPCVSAFEALTLRRALFDNRMVPSARPYQL